MNILIFLIFSSLSFLPLVTPAVCPPTCVMPSCRCPTPDFPLDGWVLSDYPQFVFFTLDDSITNKQFKNLNSLDFLLRSANIVDRKGCHPKLSYYVRQIETDFPVLNLVDKLGSVNLHTYSHTTSVSTSANVWNKELTTVRTAINQLAKLPLSRIPGSRAPYLQTNEDYFATLQALGMKFDSSLVYSNAVTKRFYWPYTLDTIPDGTFCYFGYCPTTAHPGLWEVPMSNLDYDVPANVMDPAFTITDPLVSAAYLEKMKNNFLDSYNSNRAPRGIYWSWRYIDVGDLQGLDPLKSYFLTQFYQWVAGLNNVVFATESEVIDWMKNPVKFQNMVPQCGDITPTVDNTCTQKMCSYPEGTIKVCGTICPTVYPGINPVTGTPNVWSIDPNVVQTNAAQTHWLGSTASVIHTWVASAVNAQGITEKLLCANGHFEHQGSLTAKSAIIRFKVCDALVDQSQPLYGAWGYPSDASQNNGNFNVAFLVNNVNVAAGSPGVGITDGFCLRAKDQTAMNAWNADSSAFISFGADWYSDPLTCILGNCKVWCGDGVCNAAEGETANSCPMDCKTQYSCGSYNPNPILPPNPADCNPDNCKMPDCRCATTDFVVPGWTLNDYPQFVFFTLDDSIKIQQYKNLQNLDFILKNPAIKDKKLCNPKLTFYTRQLETDFPAVNLISKVGEIALHTFSHTTSTSTSATTWSSEESTVYKALQNLGQVPPSKLTGSRAPYLQTNDAYFSTIQAMGMLYDSSMSYSNANTKRFYWPFTLDFGAPPNFCIFGMCPTTKHPGLWEVPLHNLDYTSSGNVMDPVFQNADVAAYLQLMKNNFLDSYNSNRAPRGIYWHWRYFSQGDLESLEPVRVQLLVDFFTWVSTLDNVVFATETEVINWMKNPVKFPNMVANCPNPTLTIANTCTKKTCFYQEASFDICGSVCPSIYPGITNVNGWTLDPTQIQTNALMPHWLKSNDYNSYFAAYGDNTNGKMLMCMEGHLEHNNAAPAKAALVTIKICNSLVDPVDPVEGIWGIPGGYQVQGNDFVVKYQANGINVNQGAPGFSLSDGFCLKAKNINAYNTWLSAVSAADNPTNPVPFSLASYGVDWYDAPLNCEMFNCKMWCGDGVCSTGETSKNCPIDCNNAEYVCPAIARRFLEHL